MTAPGLAKRLQKHTCFYDVEAANLCRDENDLITPVTPYGNRIRVRVLEYETLIDSSNITIED